MSAAIPPPAPTPSGPPLVGDLLALWWRRVDEAAELDDVRAELDGFRRRVRSRRSQRDVDVLLDVLGAGDGAERSAWWQMICGWPFGFPPDVSRTPADRYPLAR